ncbi:hypothetical protein M0R45_025528 [Rubus argutus]|uniref:Uncharacterized protein n=1 Tax=Rubus argutus TaxID=59490 RepID=A0AAW1WXB5_RUBAR
MALQGGGEGGEPIGGGGDWCEQERDAHVRMMGVSHGERDKWIGEMESCFDGGHDRRLREGPALSFGGCFKDTISFIVPLLPDALSLPATSVAHALLCRCATSPELGPGKRKDSKERQQHGKREKKKRKKRG